MSIETGNPSPEGMGIDNKVASELRENAARKKAGLPEGATMEQVYQKIKDNELKTWQNSHPDTFRKTEKSILRQGLGLSRDASEEEVQSAKNKFNQKEE